MSAVGCRIVVVGGGFGGLYASAYLGRSELRARGARITLVDRKNYFTFTPLLAEVAAGTLGREHVTYPYRVLARRYGFDFVREEVCEIDVELRTVQGVRARIPYDYLVLAPGAAPRFFGNPALERASLPLTSVHDALAIRGRVIGSLERASASSDEGDRRRLLTFVVAGAGPAGVEITSAIHGLATRVLPPYFPGLPPARVILADGGDTILTGFDPKLTRLGLASLRERGIDVRLNTRIEDAAPGVVTVRGPQGPDRIETHTLVWTAGTAPPPWVARPPLPAEAGAIRVDPFLRVQGLENIFAVGDAGTLTDARTGRPYPRVAPIAISQGVRAAANVENQVLGRPVEPYQAYHAGKIVPLGDGVALAEVLGFPLTGRPAWWIYRAAYLLKLVGAKNKIRVLVALALNHLFERDLTYDEEPSSRGGERGTGREPVA